MRRAKDRQQAKVVPAPESKKRHWFFAALNAPFTLWFLSVAFITVGGAFFTAHQQCLRDAENIRQNLRALEREIDARQDQIKYVIENSKSVGELREGLKTVTSKYSQFKDRDTESLFNEWADMFSQISTGELVHGAEIAWQGNELKFANLVLYGQDVHSMADAELPLIRYLAAKMATFRLLLDFNSPFKSYETTCSAPSILEGLFFSARPHVLREIRAHVPPDDGRGLVDLWTRKYTKGFQGPEAQKGDAEKPPAPAQGAKP